MKLIILDIDGVLLPEPSPTNEFSFHSVAALHHIIKSTAAQIVVSSTWRLNWPDTWSALHRVNIHPIGPTPLLLGCVRGAEIQDWMDDWDKKAQRNSNIFPITDFLILDDIEVMLEHQLPHLIRTKSKIGLQEKHIARAIRILNSGRSKE